MLPLLKCFVDLSKLLQIVEKIALLQSETEGQRHDVVQLYAFPCAKIPQVSEHVIFLMEFIKFFEAVDESLFFSSVEEIIADLKPCPPIEMSWGTWSPPRSGLNSRLS